MVFHVWLFKVTSFHFEPAQIPCINPTSCRFVFQTQNLYSFLTNRTEWKYWHENTPLILLPGKKKKKTSYENNLKQSWRHRLGSNTFIFMLLRNCRIKIGLAPCCRIALRPRGLITHLKENTGLIRDAERKKPGSNLSGWLMRMNTCGSWTWYWIQLQRKRGGERIQHMIEREERFPTLTGRKKRC